MRKTMKETYRITADRPGAPAPLGGRFGGGRFGINDRYLTKDGQPWLPVSGELHYSRLDRAMWSRELDKMKAAGLQIVSTYVFWIHHEEIRGEIRFDGNLDVGAFVDLCHEKGLEVTLRIGPWCHGECRNGGFPDWLIRACDGRVRQNAEPYLTYVRRFYQAIFQHLYGAGQKRELFSIQIDNELTRDHPHLRTLYEMALECGFDAPFFTATAWDGDITSLNDILLPTFGGYPEQPWYQSTGPSLPNPHFFFTGVRCDSNIGCDLHTRQDVREDLTRPFLTCEIGPGIQVTEHRRPRITAEDVLAMAMGKLGDGCNLLGFYMFHGGSNPVGKLSTMEESRASGYQNNLPVISYDFQAPIGESGYLRDSYYRLRTLFEFIGAYGASLAPMVPSYPDRRPLDWDDRECVRCCLRSNGEEGFLFVNQHHHGARLPEHTDVHILVTIGGREIDVNLPVLPPDVCFLCPAHMRMGTCRLDYALAQPVSFEGDRWVFEEVDGIPSLFCFSGEEPVLLHGETEIHGVKILVRKRYVPLRTPGECLAPVANDRYSWRLEVPDAAGEVELDYYGDKIAVYAGERRLADQFYYGEPLRFFKPEGVTSLAVEMIPMDEAQDIYLECPRRCGGDLLGAQFRAEA